jgi:hypothetical protein
VEVDDELVVLNPAAAIKPDAAEEGLLTSKGERFAFKQKLKKRGRRIRSFKPFESMHDITIQKCLFATNFLNYTGNQNYFWCHSRAGGNLEQIYIFL